MLVAERKQMEKYFCTEKSSTRQADGRGEKGQV